MKKDIILWVDVFLIAASFLIFAAWCAGCWFFICNNIGLLQ